MELWNLARQQISNILKKKNKKKKKIKNKKKKKKFQKLFSAIDSIC
jgi:hypothetical protein